MSFTERFSDRAGDYVSGRPSYPAGVLDPLFAGLGDPADVVVADLGAGTGISSRLLAERGAHVYAIEPNRAMRDAAEPHPNVEWIDATAEATGLHEASADLVTAFQAFHWFDHRKALDEIVRILRPAGRAAVIYNERDESDAFTAAYGDVVRKFQTDETERRRAGGLAAFEAFEGWHERRRVELRNEHVLDEKGLSARVGSTSYLPKSGPAFDELRAALAVLFQKYAADGRVVMVMRTVVVTGDVGADGG
jgi:SAM-dependent methyltransferase